MGFFKFVGLLVIAYIIAFAILFAVGSKNNHLCNGIVLSIVSLYYLVGHLKKVLNLRWIYSADDAENVDVDEPAIDKLKALWHMVMVAVFASAIMSIVIVLLKEYHIK